MPDISVQNVVAFGNNQNLKRESFMGKDEKLINIFDKYDLDKNGKLSTDEEEKAAKEIYSYSDICTKDYTKSVSGKKTKELKSQGIDFNNVVKFEEKLNSSFYSDGKNGIALQGNSADCTLLSTINALDTIPEGKDIIKQSITQKENGKIAVKLKGVNKTYEFSPQDIIDAKDTVSRGDTDVKLIELAFQKYYRELITTKTGSQDITQLATDIGNGDRTLQKPFGIGITGNQAMFLLTGKESKIYTIPKYMDKSGIEKNFFMPKNDVEKYLDKMMDPKNKNAATVAFSKDHKWFLANHTFSIKRVEKDNIIITNPWNSAIEITVSRKEFMGNLEEFNVCDLGK